MPNGAGRDIPFTLNNPFSGIIWEFNPEGWQTIAGGRGEGGRPPGSGGARWDAPQRGASVPGANEPASGNDGAPMGRAMILLNVGLVEEFWHPFGVRGLRAPGARWSVPVARTDHRLPSVSPAG